MRFTMSTNTDTHNSSCGCLRRGCLKVVTIAIMLTASLYAQQRATITLTDNWHIKHLETDKPGFPDWYMSNQWFVYDIEGQ